MDLKDNWLVFRDSVSEMLSVELAEEQLQRYKALYNLVVEANRVMNLTRITSQADFITRHLLDSLTLLPRLQSLPPTFSLVDVGSGAGFPALPLAIVFPQANILAVESVQKKARFIEKTAQTLGLWGISVVADRCETLGQSATYRERFDVATARAVSALNVLSELCLPLVKVGGEFIAMKTASAIVEELPQAEHVISLLGGGDIETLDVSTPVLANRTLISIRKLKPTPTQYPRKPGIPQKKPL